jgi:hypothetical protein
MEPATRAYAERYAGELALSLERQGSPR